MNVDWLAEFLINLMPISTGLKTLIFIVLAILMYRRGADTNLSKWINRGFFSIFLASTSVTFMTGYLVRIADSNDIHWPVEWLLIITMNLFPLWVAFVHGMIVYWSRKEEHETKNQRDTRQDAREDGLDVRAEGLDARGLEMSREVMRQKDART